MAIPFPQTVLISGCSSGFGRLMATTLASAGHRVFASMRGVKSKNAEPARQLRRWADDERVRLEVMEMDVTSAGSIDSAIAAALASAGRIDVVVNNAARGAVGPIEAFSDAQIAQLFDLNVFAAIRVSRAALPAMRERKAGLLIFVSSAIGRVLPRVGGVYAATKWALEGAAESLRYEVQPFGVDVAILEPGAFPTGAMSKAMVAARAEVRAAYAEAAATVDPPTDQRPTAGHKTPDPQEIADAVRRLIELPAGQRPLRTVVGPIFTEGVAEYNQAYERASDGLAAALRRPDQAITWRGQPPSD